MLFSFSSAEDTCINVSAVSNNAPPSENVRRSEEINLRSSVYFLLQVNEADGFDDDVSVLSVPAKIEAGDGVAINSIEALQLCARALEEGSTTPGPPRSALPVSLGFVCSVPISDERGHGSRRNSPVAYTFTLSEDVVPLAWELQGTHGGGVWRSLDSRKVDKGGAAGLVFPVAPSTAGACWRALRIVVHDVVGASGGHSRRINVSLAVTSFRVWLAAAAAEPSWAFGLSGMSGLRRLRFKSLDGSIDVVTASIIDTRDRRERRSEGLAIHLAVEYSDREGWFAGIRINGQAESLVSVTEALANPLGASEARHIGDGSCIADDPYSFFGADCAPAASFQNFRLGAASRLNEAHRAPKWGSFAFDAPAFPQSRLGSFTGSISGLAFNAISGRSAYEYRAPSSMASILHRPIRSLEHIALWQPFPSIDQCLRSKEPLATRYTASEETLRPSENGFFARGRAEGLLPPSGALSLLCHDCGPTVYREDAWAYGLTTEGPRDVELSARDEASEPSAPVPNRACATSVLPASDVSDPSLLMGHCARFEIGLSHSDVFIYFSHARLSPPPRSWVSAAHRVGARVLGTICTEWSDGAAANCVLAWDGANNGSLAKAAAMFAAYFDFDGWLVNIEAPLILDGLGADLLGAGVLEPDQRPKEVEALAAFVRALSIAAHARRGGLIIWYDSVDSQSGAIAWASALDGRGAPFFDAADAIFLDYHWSLEGLEQTKAYAGDRSRDVCVGLDVWGRGMLGGGGWRCGEAAAAAASRGLSVAIFAPAWTHEARGGSNDVDSARKAEDRLWHGREVSVLQVMVSSEGFGDAKVTNASGLALDSKIAAELSDISRLAVAAASCMGWCIEKSGGDGWAVLRDDAWSQRDKVTSSITWHGDPDEVIDIGDMGADEDEGCGVACFATSYSWCEASQIITLPPNRRGASAAIVVSEWIRGGTPNSADPYELRIQELDAMGEALDQERTTGKLLAGERWHRVGLSQPLQPATCSVRVTHLGRDSNSWAGHFGVRIRALRVQVFEKALSCVKNPAHAVSAPAQGLASLSDVIGGPRSCAATLPFSTCFNAGAGMSRWSMGDIKDTRPWCDLAVAEPLPSRLGFNAAAIVVPAALQGRHPRRAPSHGDVSTIIYELHSSMPSPDSLPFASLSHSSAWEGGTSVTLSAYVPEHAAGPPGDVICAFFNLLAVHLYLSKNISVSLTVRGSPESWVFPVLIFEDGSSIVPSHSESELLGSGWSRDTWAFPTSPPPHKRVKSVSLALCHTGRRLNDESMALSFVRLGRVELV
jgi:hypothetical protein